MSLFVNDKEDGEGYGVHAIQLYMYNFCMRKVRVRVYLTPTCYVMSDFYDHSTIVHKKFKRIILLYSQSFFTLKIAFFTSYDSYSPPHSALPCFNFIISTLMIKGVLISLQHIKTSQKQTIPLIRLISIRCMPVIGSLFPLAHSRFFHSR